MHEEMRMLTWIVATSPWRLSPLAEACPRPSFVCVIPTPRWALGFGAGWRTAQRTTQAPVPALASWEFHGWPMFGRAAPRPERALVRTAQRAALPTPKLIEEIGIYIFTYSHIYTFTFHICTYEKMCVCTWKLHIYKFNFSHIYTLTN